MGAAMPAPRARPTRPLRVRSDRVRRGAEGHARRAHLVRRVSPRRGGKLET